MTALRVLVALVGLAMVLGALFDMVNALVRTHTAWSRWWFATSVYLVGWRLVKRIASHIGDEARRERRLANFAPISLLVLLVGWIVIQVVGWGLIWWAIGGLKGTTGLGDSLYYSGVVYFTIGFGEIVPSGAIPRVGALMEAFGGLLSTALVIGYLPLLFGAYADRERQLMLLDDGTEHRITPTNLLIARVRPGHREDLDSFFGPWEDWTAGVLATHSSYPMLLYFRSQQASQHWVTALGLVCDSAAQVSAFMEDECRSAEWMLRRGTRLFQQLGQRVDLSEYVEAQEALYANRRHPARVGLYDQLVAAGYRVRPLDEGLDRLVALRRMYVPHMEFLIDYLEAPRGFWPHSIGRANEFEGQVVEGLN